MIAIDIEVAVNFTSIAAIRYDERDNHIFFAVHESIDQRREYIDFLNEIILNSEVIVTFNGIHYDYPVIHRILKNQQYFLTASIQEATSWIYNVSNSVIAGSASYIDKPLIKQYDLFKIFHFDNKARSASLKKLQMSMRMPRVGDLPFDHDQPIDSSMIQIIKDYNIDDVLSTLSLLDIAISEGKITTRTSVLSVEYPEVEFTNMSDVAIGEAIIVSEIEKEQGFPIPNISYKEISPFKISDILLSYYDKYITHRTFKDLLRFFRGCSIFSTKGSFPQYELKFNGLTFYYGQGGIHASVQNKIISEDIDYMLVDWDVISFYPNIAIVNNIHPSHVGRVFNVVYKRIYDKRASIPKSDPMNGAYKLSLNGAFGKSGDGFSKLFDPKTTMAITINGQLLLSMFINMMHDKVGKDVTVIQANTDGCTFKIKRSRESDMLDVVDKWQQITSLTLERADYKKMIISDVNNYIAIKTNNKVKYKGRFEINKELHKNPSMRIVPIAIANYFINDVPVKDTISKHQINGDYNLDDGSGKGTIIKNFGIHDFTIMCRSKPSPDKGKAYFYLYSIFNGEFQKVKLQKLNRYIVSKSGSSKIIKEYEDGSVANLTADKVGNKIANDISNVSFDDLNYGFYIQKAEKIINSFEHGGKVKNLFDY